MSNMSDTGAFSIFSHLHDSIMPYANFDIMLWLWSHQTIVLSLILLIPLVVTFVLPIFMLTLVYISALYLKAYRYYFKANGYVFTPDSWKGARKLLAYLYDAQARFWYENFPVLSFNNTEDKAVDALQTEFSEFQAFKVPQTVSNGDSIDAQWAATGYQIEGLENIPDEGPALIVFYHGSMPVDWYYLLANTVLYKKRLICAVGDRFLFKVPAFDALIDCFQVYPGSVDTCADMLRKGNLLAIAPGGVREALFGDENYPLLWGTRIGFAKVAIEAGVPIIPVFTKNIREAFFTLNFGRSWLRGIYEKTRIPLVPIYGGFPVKLKTIVGKPIPYDPESSAEEMAEKVAKSMKKLISLHQQTPGSVTRSVKERFQYLMKRKCS